jgi:hypothetical protein
MPDVAELCREVEKTGGSNREIEAKLAFIAVKDVNGFDELRKVICPQKPQAVIAYERLSEMDKIRFLQANPNFFRSDGEGGKFYEAKTYAIHITKRNIEWLKRMKEIFEKANVVPFVQKVQERINEFDVVPKHSFEHSMVGNAKWEE